MSRICIDLDGVIAKLKKGDETYETVEPVPGAVEKLKSLRAAGHYIIIFTARHMKTCDGNPGKVVARLAKTTLEWLDRYEIPYDEVHFGKPWADVYIDDNAFRFETWETVSPDGSNLPVSSETTHALKQS
jgi:capsule biosynthesis phosphatase